ncbi:gamma-aminobutyric acid receptor subunit pi-like [Pseudophryne corroboree]|uniref:gamma-aminobutyric acid receptor subunit pi-like n=1 Tax=Pseudophryne corroboree TaxID=495146 RepID=UPI00308130A0
MFSVNTSPSISPLTQAEETAAAKRQQSSCTTTAQPAHSSMCWLEKKLLLLTEADQTDAVPGFQNLTKDYNKYLRPQLNAKPVEISVTLEVASIASVSEENMDYTATIFLRQRWTDERLMFDGNKSITLDPRLVQLLWVPDTYIVESKKSFLHDVTVDNRLVRLYANGTVLYALRITTTVACNMDLTKYPMDRQTCKLQFESWGYTARDLVYTWMRGNDSIRGMNSLQLAQYTVEKYHTSVTIGRDETGTYPRLILYFVLKRNIIYFILETYIPSTLLVVLSWISFWISRTSVPARTCIGVTTVLAMTTILMGSRSTFPTANCIIKAVDVYLGICFSFIFGALLEYAIAHYCTEQHSIRSTSVKKNLPEGQEENVIIPINDTSKELIRNNSQIENIVAETDEHKCNTNNIKLKFWLKIRGKFDMFIDLFTVKNPENIDRYSRIVFPLIFLIINLFYWVYYLYF